MSSNTYSIYGLGAALVDTEIPTSDHDLEQLGVDKGLMTLVDEARQALILDYFDPNAVENFKRASGGSAANSVIAASQFGSHCYFTGRVANDTDGELYLGDLEKAGVSTYGRDAMSQEGTTGKCLVMVTPDAERSMNTYLGISEQLSPALLDESAAASANYAYIEGYLVTSPTGKAAAQRLCEVVRENNNKVAVSLSDPGIVQFFRAELEAMFGQQVDLLFCNEDEALMWADTQSLDEAKDVLKQYAKQLVITRGAKEAILWDGDSEISVPAQKVTAIDTNGAGDLFAGAFLHAYNQGHSFKRSGEFACLAASKIVQVYGPRLSAQAYQELAANINN